MPIKNAVKPDRGKVNMQSDEEVMYWCRYLGVSPAQLAAHGSSFVMPSFVVPGKRLTKEVAPGKLAAGGSASRRTFSQQARFPNTEST